MSGFIIHDGAYITCPHTSGIATPNQTDTHVKVSGQPIMTVVRTYKIGGCPQNTPCSSAIWTEGAEHVTASGLAVAISTGKSLCVPPGELKPQIFQQRVKAS
jgi:hypothetical protein